MRLPGGQSLRTGHKACPVCRGWGAIFEDRWQIEDTEGNRLAAILNAAPPATVPKQCGECEGTAQVPIGRHYPEPDPRPGAVYRRHMTKYPYKNTPNLRYCDLCGDYAERADLRGDGMTVHASLVCSQFEMRSLASQAIVGAVVVSGRFLNNALPALVTEGPTAPLNGYAGWVGLVVVLGRWARTEGAAWRLVFDGAVLARDFPGTERVPRAMQAIERVEGFMPHELPEDWLRVSDEPLRGIYSPAVVERPAYLAAAGR